MICSSASRNFLSFMARNALLLGLLTGSPFTFSQSRPLLTPEPREVQAAELLPIHSFVITVPGRDTEDYFTAHNLEKTFRKQGISISSAAGPGDVTVSLLRLDSLRASRFLAGEHLLFDNAMQDEGYILVSHPGHVTLIGKTAAGVFYAAQTLKQLVVAQGGVSKLWTCTIRDWPAMKYRGVHDDLSRGPFPTLDFQKHQLEVFAAHKVNLYSPYFEYTLQYSIDPLPAPPGSSLIRTEAKDLAAYARDLHIMIVPEQEAFGHLHHVLQYESYSDLAETAHGHVLAPGQAGSLALIKSWFTQIAEDFPGPLLHIGADETFELGTGRTKAEVDKRGVGPVYADFLNAIHTTLAPLHRRLLFWGDVAWSDPSAIDHLPKDMIAIPWVYWHENSYDRNILPFKKAGIETWVAPGDANWGVVYPLGNSALDNISGFVESGQRLGSTGELTTVWNDDGEGLFNQDWFGVLFGAAAGWQSGKSDGAAYQATFGQAFFGDTSGRIDEAQQELMAATNQIDVSDNAFWLDPWSPQGQAKGARMWSNIPSARLHAERAIELIETVLLTEPRIQERTTLQAMELGARRVDFIGMKFQLAEEMSVAYAKAYGIKDDKNRQSEIRNLLSSLSSINGRCQDLRDGYSMLKNLYRDSWLAENRPYWLDNVLVRYDLRIQQWQRRGEEIDMLIQDWQNTKVLPTAEQAGIPPPPQPEP